jgi:hypothetical protein
MLTELLCRGEELYRDGEGRRRRYWLSYGHGPTFRNQHRGGLVGKFHDVSHSLIGHIDPIPGVLQAYASGGCAPFHDKQGTRQLVLAKIPEIRGLHVER